MAHLLRGLLLLLLHLSPIGCVDGGDGLTDARSRRQDLLIYNRVPKSGSSSMQDLLKKLRTQNKLKLLHYATPPYVECPPPKLRVLPCVHNNSFVDNPSPESVRSLAEHINAIQAEGLRVVLDYHFHYVNFTALGLPRPLHINTLRDPVDRVVSQYYYARYGSRPTAWKRRVLKAYGNLTVEECLELYTRCGCEGSCEARSGCTRLKCADLFHNFNSQLLFFCPWGSPACAARDASTLEAAKAALLEYDAVGVLERTEESLALFEAVLPQFFSGASRLGPQQSRTNDANKGLGGSQVREDLVRLNALDMEFYRFAVEQLDIKLQLMSNGSLHPQGSTLQGQ